MLGMSRSQQEHLWVGAVMHLPRLEGLVRSYNILLTKQSSLPHNKQQGSRHNRLLGGLTFILLCTRNSFLGWGTGIHHSNRIA